MCHHECTEKLNNLINNLNNESLNKICTNIDKHVISLMNDKIDNFTISLRIKNKRLRYGKNEYLLHKHFLLQAIKDVNVELIQNNAGFIIDVSDNLLLIFRKKYLTTFIP